MGSEMCIRDRVVPVKLSELAAVFLRAFKKNGFRSDQKTKEKEKTAEQHREIARTHAEGRPDVVVVNRVEAEKTSEGHEHQTGPKISLILDHR